MPQKIIEFDMRSRLEKIALDDLPKYTDWPKRLLSLESFDIKYKTEKEVLREYQDEEWGNLLKRAKLLNNPSPLEVEELYVDYNSISPCYLGGEFYLANARQTLEMHLDLYAQILEPYIKDASCLVELGAGYGSKIMNLAQRGHFSELPLIAGEFTQSGRDLISILADAWGKSINVGYCDFRGMKLEDIAIPENAVIFTSYAVHYVPELSMEFVNFLSRLKPKVVVHFEPCYEHYSLDSFHGLMCKRYIELNDYTRNLVSVIEEGRNREGISVRVRENILGSNPFLPISVIEWSPVGCSEILA